MYAHQLGQIIQQLLQQHPMVIVPGLGGLVTERVPAKLDAHRGRMVPPSMTVLFNAQLDHNDGLLAQRVATHWGFAPLEADLWLTDAISELRFTLAKGEAVQWQGIGTLRQDHMGQLRFTPDADSIPLLDAFGLRPLQVVEVQRERDIKVIALHTARTLPIKRIAGYAAAAMVAGIMIWLPFQQGVVDNGKHLVAEMGLMTSGNQMAYTPRMFQPTWQMPTPEAVEETIAVTADTVAVEVEEEAVAYPTQFHVVAASFADRTAADAHLAKLQQRGFVAEYAGVDAQGAHLVAYATYASVADAEAMLASVSLSNKEARIVAH